MIIANVELYTTTSFFRARASKCASHAFHIHGMSHMERSGTLLDPLRTHSSYTSNLKYIPWRKIARATKRRRIKEKGVKLKQRYACGSFW